MIPRGGIKFTTSFFIFLTINTVDFFWITFKQIVYLAFFKDYSGDCEIEKPV
jgi:hypothetical protein